MKEHINNIQSLPYIRQDSLCTCMLPRSTVAYVPSFADRPFRAAMLFQSGAGHSGRHAGEVICAQTPLSREWVRTRPTAMWMWAEPYKETFFLCLRCFVLKLYLIMLIMFCATAISYYAYYVFYYAGVFVIIEFLFLAFFFRLKEVCWVHLLWSADESWI